MKVMVDGDCTKHKTDNGHLGLHPESHMRSGLSNRSVLVKVRGKSYFQ